MDSPLGTNYGAVVVTLPGECLIIKYDTISDDGGPSQLFWFHIRSMQVTNTWDIYAWDSPDLYYEVQRHIWISRIKPGAWYTLQRLKWILVCTNCGFQPQGVTPPPIHLSGMYHCIPPSVVDPYHFTCLETSTSKFSVQYPLFTSRILLSLSFIPVSVPR